MCAWHFLQHTAQSKIDIPVKVKKAWSCYLFFPLMSLLDCFFFGISTSRATSGSFPTKEDMFHVPVASLNSSDQTGLYPDGSLTHIALDAYGTSYNIVNIRKRCCYLLLWPAYYPAEYLRSGREQLLITCILSFPFCWLLRTCLTLCEYLVDAASLVTSLWFPFTCGIPRYL